jgi:hypothetical protein
MESLGALLNKHQAAYILLCYAGLALVLVMGAWAVLPAWRDELSGSEAFRPHWGRGISFLLALGGTILLFRLPNILTNRIIEIDECGHIVAGWSALHDPIPWRGADHGSSGPLNSYVLAAAFRLGLPVNFVTARIVLVLLFLAFIGCTYATLVKIGGQLAAVLPALALGLFVCLASDMDHTHYNSEAVSVALLAGAALCYVLGRERVSHRLRWLYGAGLLLGAAPYAKLQAAPPGCFLALVLVFDVWRSRAGLARWWPSLMAVVAGGLTFPLLFTMVLLATGMWKDFLMSYFGFASVYGFQSAPRWLAATCAFCGPDIPWFLLYCLLVPVGLFACLSRVSGASPGRNRLLIGACFGYLAAAVFAVQAPRTGFTHYAVLVLHPAALLFGVCVCITIKALAAGARSGSQFAPKAAVTWVLGLTAAFVAVHAFGWRLEMPPEEDFFPTLRGKPPAGWIPYLPIEPPRKYPIAEFITRHAHAGDTMSVWGWAPHYYVFSGVPNATRYANTAFAMPPTPLTAGVTDSLRAYYRTRYLQDLQRSMPAFFVDAVSGAEFTFIDRQIWGHELEPELAAFVKENYVQAFELFVGPGDGTRVYMLKGRAAH